MRFRMHAPVGPAGLAVTVRPRLLIALRLLSLEA